MGKKKTQKTKEIAVAIAETSTSKLADDGIGQSIQPRKRGRPRKVLDEQQNEQENKKLPPPPPLLPEVEENPPEKKIKATVDEPPPGSVKEGSKQEEPKTGDGSRSRGRRKNKPRKSS
ncbi:zinc finger and BTB domain-containing protein 47 [Cucumis melo var. makuwa]|uniref:Zinc finger and BTB domain-containing protein 47 n=2 Tax=Cucumis melo TaxID=3656 RepID=A0A5A7VIE6_CUCMM|nr:zinc finger and BTB domain-containing protein 47 [Cucumis melo var. makuwa]